MMFKILPIVFLVILIAGCTSPVKYSKVTIGNTTINAEIADTDAERARGLMGRASVAEGEGMIFVFPDSAKRSFWMKDTLIPLDIIFLDELGNVVNVQHAVPCETLTCPTYESAGDAKYVLEVNAGFAEAHNMSRGSYAEILGC